MLRRFGAVYELFGHQVYSCFMICVFAFPLLLGLIPFFLMQKLGRAFPGRSADLIHAGVAALTVGSILQGVLEIYGTTNPLTSVYWISGGLIPAAGWLLTIGGHRENRAIPRSADDGKSGPIR